METAPCLWMNGGRPQYELTDGERLPDAAVRRNPAGGRLDDEVARLSVLLDRPANVAPGAGWRTPVTAG